MFGIPLTRVLSSKEMNTDDSQQLLAEYVDNASEPAFRALVERYINPVYSTALRLVGGDAHLAQDITQTVFADLARKAAKLPPATVLGGWLHRDTCFVASKALRGERRRQFRERQAVAMNAQEDHSAANLALVAPILDDAINQLDPADRTAILLRFFEQLDFRAIGEKMGSNEDAARMRVNRALEKMEVMLKHRGVTLSAAALGTALAIGFVSTAPLGLAATVAGTALAGASAGGITAPLLKFLTMSHLKIALIGTAAVAALAVPTIVQHQSLAKLRDENQSLSNQIVQLAPLQEENQRLSNQVSQATSSQTPTDQQVHELARLRGQVALLSQQTNDLTRALVSGRQYGFGIAGRRKAEGRTTTGKLTHHGMTMPEFAGMIGEMIGAPVTDRTGLSGVYDIMMTPPKMDGLYGSVEGIARYGSVESVTSILRDELGLQLYRFGGPFTPEEVAASMPTRIITSIKPDGTYTLTTNTTVSTDGGFAIKLDHSGAPGLKVSDGKYFPDEHAQNVSGPGADLLSGHSDGSGLDSEKETSQQDQATADRNACINNLRMIDSAKQQWALEFHKTANDTPTMDDIKPYLGRGPEGEIPVCPDGGVYIIGKVGEKPTCSIPGHVLP
jgi:RNA polymerase sigma factor (sigma-70 family)